MRVSCVFFVCVFWLVFCLFLRVYVFGFVFYVYRMVFFVFRVLLCVGGLCFFVVLLCFPVCFCACNIFCFSCADGKESSKNRMLWVILMTGKYLSVRLPHARCLGF